MSPDNKKGPEHHPPPSLPLISEALVPGPPVSASCPDPALPLRAQAPHLEGDSSSLGILEPSYFHIISEVFIQFLTESLAVGRIGCMISLESVAFIHPSLPCVKMAGRNISNLRNADNTTLLAESEEELKSLLKVKEESEKLA